MQPIRLSIYFKVQLIIKVGLGPQFKGHWTVFTDIIGSGIYLSIYNSICI